MNQNDDLFFFPSPFVFTYKVPEHEQIKEELKPTLESFYQSNYTKLKYKWTNDSTFNSKMCTNYRLSSEQRTWYTKEHLQAIVWNPIDKLLEQLGSKTSKCKMTMFWWNVYHKGDFAPLHNHGLYGISGVYLLHLNEQNKTIFTYNNPALLKNDHNVEYYNTDHITEGSVLLFPSSLNHSVDPAETTRMTISFNVEIN